MPDLAGLGECSKPTAQVRTSDLKAAAHGRVAGSASSAGLEENIWLCPIEDQCGLDSPREGMMERFSLGSYLPLVDYTGRLSGRDGGDEQVLGGEREKTETGQHGYRRPA